MPRCDLVETRRKRVLPACSEQLDGAGRCRIHCRARLRGERAGKLCVNHHVKNKRGCRMHGGKQKVGLASPNLKTGEHSRYLSTLEVVNPELAARYRERADAQNYLSLAPDIYMVQVRIDELVHRALTSSESGNNWRKAKSKFQDFMTCQEKKDQTGAVAALTELNSLLAAGADEYDAWDEVKDLWSKLQRLAESERKRELEFSEVVQTTYVLHILKNLAESVKRNVKDDTAREAITIDIARCTGGAIRSLVTTRKTG